MPTNVIIANPILGSMDLKIDKDCVVMYNTKADKSSYLPSYGLEPLLKQTATLLADNIVSINCKQINTRVEAIFTADTPALKNTAEMVLKNLYSGKPYQVVAQNIMGSLQVNPMASTPGSIKDLVELHQFILSQFYNNVGIKTAYNMKRERLITDEMDTLDDFCAVSLDNMLTSRKIAIDKINEMFGTNITVGINPILDFDTESEQEPEKEDEPSE